ncbi:MAG: histone deacetylase family protein [Hyphomicrobiales bacterium]|nr:histone deacetylase family protein [Hyphomicrobiales bacterium]
MGTLYITHPAFLAHDTGPGHPERADRIRAVDKALGHPVFAGLARREAPLSGLEPMGLVHDDRYIASLEAASPKAGIAHLDSDTVMSPGTWEAARRAVGATLLATDAVMSGAAKNAFCAVRPPGHHAEAARAYGFCLFNNAAIAAVHARVRHGAERVAVVDIDVHHGNGTQNMFWRDRNLFYASSHQMPLFPGTGHPSETGAHNNIVNVALKHGDDGARFREAYEARILPALAAFRPDLIIVSAGFDAHHADPLGGVALTEADFAWVTRALLDAADKHCSGRVVSLLEGGYDLTGLAKSAAAHVRELLAASQ